MQLLKLGGNFYPRTFLASGLLNFDQSGYSYHKLLPWRFLKRLPSDLRVTFTAKTLTDGQEGNMPLCEDGITTKEFFPRCIVASMLTGHTINAVGLSCKPYQFYFDRGIWQDIRKPFAISYLANAPTAMERIDQVKRFAEAWAKYAPTLRYWPLLFLNGGCPNVEHRSAFADEIAEQVLELKATGTTVGINFSPIVDLGLCVDVSYIADLLAICNTIPHRYMYANDNVWPWKEESPLTKRGYPEGGWSGPRCLKYALKKVSQVRAKNKEVTIVLGNGIQRPKDVMAAQAAGADAISIGILPVVRPFGPLMEAVIHRASSIDWRRNKEVKKS